MPDATSPRGCLHVLLVEDEEADAALVLATTQEAGGNVALTWIQRLSEAIARLTGGERRFDAVLLDLNLPDSTGLNTVARLSAAAPEVPVVVLTGAATATGVEALEAGAEDYLSKWELTGFALDRSLRYAIERRRRAERERAVGASEERLRQFCEATGQLVFATDAAGRFEYVNRPWAEYTGARIGENSIGRCAQSLPDDEDRERVCGLWRASLASGEPLETEARLRRARGGEPRWFLFRAAPCRDDRGAVTRWIGICTDIHAQKEAEERLRRANERLEDSDRHKTEFLAMLSHELRNPLAPIRNSTYLLKRAMAGSEQALRAHQVIERQVAHLSRLVDQLLDVTRISRGKVRLERERIDLARLVQRAFEDQRGQFVRAGIEFEVDVGGGGGEPIWVDGDATRLLQVVGNLLQNAVKFTPRGGRTQLSVARAGECAVLRVRDTGAGMSEETLRQLFEPFVQAGRTVDRSPGGLGLGLALVKGLVELHGGTISATSAGPRKGAEFVITLPLAAAARGEAGAAAPN